MLSKLLGTLGLAAVLAQPPTVEFAVVHRDFPANWAHACNTQLGADPANSITPPTVTPVTGLVEATLGSDGKPVYVGGDTLISQETFDQWFRTGSWNREVDSTVTLNRDVSLTASGTSTYVWESTAFWPIDGQGFDDVNDAGRPQLNTDGHNGLFTSEIHESFTYRGGEQFEFAGDDDVWVFINRQLVIDMGGMHARMSRTVVLDSLGLTVGESYPLDFFHAERCCCGSNFKIQTSISFGIDPPSPPPSPPPFPPPMPPDPPSPPPIVCDTWCNHRTCEKAECRECPPPMCNIRTRCDAEFCNEYTCEKERCQACGVCRFPGATCSLWCNRYICPDSRNRGSSFLASHCGGCSFCNQ